MKAFGYIRVSTDKQGNSMEMQLEKINQFASYKGIEIVDYFQDEDVSAGKPIKKRPSGSKMIQLIETTPSVKAIVITSLTRAFRNLVDAISTADYLRKKKVAIFLVDDGIEVDTSTPNGFLQFGMQALIAQWERMIISKRTSDIQQSKKSRSEVYCYGRYGYKIIGRTYDENGKVVNKGIEVPDEYEMSIVNDIKTMYLDNISMSKIASYLNSKGVKTKRNKPFWTHSQVKSVLVTHEIFGNIKKSKSVLMFE